jgi:DNA-binding phage protein
MALTRDFKTTVQARVLADPAFRDALLREGIEAMLGGDVDTGKSILRDYIKATVGFEKLGAETGSSAKSLMRMFGPRGNPQARNLFAVLGHLQKHAKLTLHVTAKPLSTR